ncbi:PucR family transcriptional regulator [Nocardioides carbamazepini]|uniref:PucR family transcriptional regulator n=1 Tax=Nocardioides carbamazepini TaxID=2854259 RepID=UPI00214A2DFC|nr:helix-turn-helix domain-containing protein [Nocardioides carbamazepini]
MSTGVGSLLRSEDLQELVDVLAERLQRSVALDDPALSLIVASRHFGDEDAVRVQSVLGRGVDPELRAWVLSLGIAEFDGPRRIATPADIGAKDRVCAPVRCAGLLLGFLWLIDDGRVTDDDLRDTALVADKAGMILYRRDLFMQRRQARCNALVRDLISADEPTRVAAQLEAIDEELLTPTAAVSVSVVRPVDVPGEIGGSAAALTQVAEHATSMGTDPAILCLPRPRDLVVLVAHTRDGSADAALSVVRALVGSVTERVGVGVIVGVGARQVDVVDAHRSYQQALIAVRAARFLPGLDDVVTWDSLGVYGLLAKLDPQDPALGPHLAPLAGMASSRNGAALLSTAETFLDLAGNVQRAAQTLHIHRATLYQRLARIEELTGLDFDDGRDRLTLHLGLKLMRLAGSLPRSG